MSESSSYLNAFTLKKPYHNLEQNYYFFNKIGFIVIHHGTHKSNYSISGGQCNKKITLMSESSSYLNAFTLKKPYHNLEQNYYFFNKLGFIVIHHGTYKSNYSISEGQCNNKITQRTRINDITIY
jgi:hypothetical protein